MACLAVYDVSGIQQFVFGSPKAKENIGASLYVQQLLEEKLKNALTGNGVKDWETQSAFDQNQLQDYEILYIGGGNGLVVFKDKTTAVETTKQLSKTLLEETQGSLNVVVAYHDTQFNDFKGDREALFQSLAEKKDNYLPANPMRGVALSRLHTDGLPATTESPVDKQPVSQASATKMKHADQRIFSDLFITEKISGWEFPKEFDHLGQIEGGSHIAVLHIDGNSMGEMIDKALDRKNEYSQAIDLMRKISKGIKNTYEEVFKQLVQEVAESCNDEQIAKNFDLKKEGGKTYLPLRPIILNGDDVTFVCEGRIGIQLGVRFIEILSEKKLSLSDQKDVNLSACAGIAIVKSHFPFHRAYELAESLCASAKKKAKALNKAEPGCWFDYHIVYSGFQQDLDMEREEVYSVPDINTPSSMDYPKYHLLLRPFQVNGGCPNEEDKWDETLKVYDHLTKNWPRLRLKSLRNDLKASASLAEESMVVHRSRGFDLPKFNFHGSSSNGENPFSASNQTPYYEPLELLDFYIPELNLGKTQNPSNGGES